MNKPTFKEYCQSKDALRLAVGNVPRVTETYELTKYCKFPIVTEEETIYVSFKPKDRVEVVWERLDQSLRARSVRVTCAEEDDTRVQPAWGDQKLFSWLENNTKKADR